MAQAVSHRPLSAETADSADHVGFVVVKVALGQVSLRLLSLHQCAVTVTAPVRCYCHCTSALLLSLHQFAVIVTVPVRCYCHCTSALLLSLHQCAVTVAVPVRCYCHCTNALLL